MPGAPHPNLCPWLPPAPAGARLPVLAADRRHAPPSASRSCSTPSRRDPSALCMGIATLVTIPFSHFCEKARWGLDRAGVRYVEEGHMPGFHRLAVRRTGSRRTSVPVLVVDGRAIGDSTEILA